MIETMKTTLNCANHAAAHKDVVIVLNDGADEERGMTLLNFDNDDVSSINSANSLTMSSVSLMPTTNATTAATQPSLMSAAGTLSSLMNSGRTSPARSPTRSQARSTTATGSATPVLITPVHAVVTTTPATPPHAQSEREWRKAQMTEFRRHDYREQIEILQSIFARQPNMEGLYKKVKPVTGEHRTQNERSWVASVYHVMYCYRTHCNSDITTFQSKNASRITDKGKVKLTDYKKSCGCAD